MVDTRMFKFETNMLGLKCNPLMLIICFILGSLVGTFVFCSCTRFSFLESFSNFGSNLDYNIGDGVGNSYTNKVLEKVNSSTSSSSVSPGEILKDSMNIFNKTTFSHGCCPSLYSTSSGCACNTKDIQDFINKRGNNRSSCDMY